MISMGFGYQSKQEKEAGGKRSMKWTYPRDYAVKICAGQSYEKSGKS
jgi:hypothetical protein